MKNKFFKKHTNRKHFVTLVIFLLLSSACSLFSGSWEDGVKYREQGEALLTEKKYEESIDAFTKSLAIIENIDDRGNNISGIISNTYRLRGKAYFNLKNYDKSLEDFNKSIQANPNATEAAYPERGNLFLVKKDYEKAIADFEKARPSYSNDYRPTLGMAIAYYETQKYEKANEFIPRALRDLRELNNSEKQFDYDPDDHIKAYEYSIKLSEQKGDIKNAELEKQSLEELKKKHNKN
jgi:tetratricopeptide (TPR) repeat protein